MALSNYQRNDLQNAIVDATINPNIGTQVALTAILNRTARMVYMEADLKSAKRYAALTPNIFDDVYTYVAPTDLKDYAIIDVRPQAEPTRTLNSRVRLVTPEAFSRKKGGRNLYVSVLDDELARVLLIDIDVNDNKEVVSTLDSLDAGSSTNWVLFGDATNVVLDTNNKVEGGGSVKFDLVGSGTTAGIQNSGIDSFAIGTDVVDSGAAFAWIYINSITNITNFILRIGSSSTVYFQITETTDAAGNAFVNGWNLIRFDFADKTETGTVDRGAIDYVAIYMTKTSGKNDDGYRVDALQLHSGEIYNILYYSKFPWQTASSVYAENSTQGTDYLNCDTDDFDIFVFRGKMELARELRDWEQYKFAEAEYQRMLQKYKLVHPSERLKLESEYSRF